ncbi:MAG: alanine racemase [Spirochaetales bacterium]|nr:alanine racemase [Spirochaetales bacterium]
MGISKAVIKLNNLKHNYREIRRKIKPGIKLCAAVKADAYGHGAVEIAKVLVAEGCDYLAVACVSEAEELRASGIKCPIMLLSLALPAEYEQVIEAQISPLVCTSEHIREYRNKCEGRKLNVHLHIDTGMGRIGCRPDQALALAAEIEESSSLRLEGICTHFPLADDDSRKGMTATTSQLGLFNGVLEELRRNSLLPDYIHAANSGAIAGHRGSNFNMVRPGIMLYGYYPSHDQKRQIKLKPVMEFRSKVMLIKKLKKGDTVSYGMTWTAVKHTEIAVVAAGYADGVSRHLSGKGEVMINGKRYKIAGRITMDQFMIDLGTSHDVELYDDVIIFGDDRNAPSAEEQADHIGTIPYEVLCNVSGRVERIYI